MTTPPHDPALYAGDAVTTEKEKPRALVVDDVPDVTEMIALLLKYAGYNVTSASSGVQALEAARAEQFDALISDIGLPHIDGYELLEQLRRAQPALRAVPAVALTGYVTARDIARARDAGFAAHVPKPVDPTTLTRLVEQLLAQETHASDEP